MRTTLLILLLCLANLSHATTTGTWMRTRGISMLPVLQPGDSVLVEALPFDQLRAYVADNPGTIVLFYNYFARNRQFPITAHAAFYFNRRGVLVCKGTNNPKRDICGVTARNYIGVVTHIRRERDGIVVMVGPGIAAPQALAAK